MEKKRTHEAGGVGGVSPDLAIDLDQALHDDRSHLLARQSVLEAVAEEDGEGEGLAQLVWAGRGAGSLKTRSNASTCCPVPKSPSTYVGTAQLVEHP